MNKYRKKLKQKTVVFLLLGLFLFLAFAFMNLNVANAAEGALFNGEEEAFQEITGLSDESLTTVIARLVSIALGFVGTIFLVIILYAGFLWMTAGGDSEKVDKAKKWLTNSVIGLVIVASSWAIASFVTSSIDDAVTGGGAYGGSGGSGSGSGGGFSGGGSGGFEDFQVNTIIPEGELAIRNLKIKVYFNRNVDASTISPENVFVTNNGTAVAGALTMVNNRLASFLPDEACPDPNSTYHCFDADSDFTVNVLTGVLDIDGNSLSQEYTVDFHTGSLVDVSDPMVTMVLPLNYQSVPVDDLVELQAHLEDDAGVTVIEFYADSNLLGSPVILDPASTNEDVYSVWATAEIDPLTVVPLYAKVFDLADNEKKSSIIKVMTRPAYCFNGVLDEDEGEIEIDCGADCGSCEGGSCEEDSDCQSGLCVSGTCEYQVKITALTPDSSASGNYMTIKGVNFGEYDDNNSEVLLINKLNGDTFFADLACGEESWHNNYIVIEIPEFTGLSTEDLNLFVVEVVTNFDCSGELCSDNTENDHGWRGYFEHDASLVLPGLCNISPNEGYAKTEVSVDGINLSSSGQVFFGDYEADHNGAWGNTAIDGILLPYLEAGTISTQVLVDGLYTNPLYYKVLQNEDSPIIDSVSPDNAAVGQYIYINGSDFGDTIANVWFKNNLVGQVAADTSFPAICSDSWWYDDFIIVKVPSLVQGDYEIFVTTNSGDSNALPFVVNNRPLSPGICKIDPNLGPSSTEVSIYGDNFSNTAQEIRIDAIPFININDWGNQKIDAAIPNIGAGNYNVKIVSTEGDYSNAYKFKVAYCADESECNGLSCCSDGSCREQCEITDLGAAFYQWKFSTGKIPFLPKVIVSKDCSTNLQSPSPWKNSNYACVNANVSARFNMIMESSSIINGVSVSDCGNDQNCDCNTENPCIDVSGIVNIVDTSETDEDGNDHPMNGFSFSSDSHLLAEHWYKVFISDSVMNEAGVHLASDYAWKFQVRESGDLCRIEGVDILPENNIMQVTETEDYNTILRGENCMVLNPSDYEFIWTLSNNSENFVEFVAETVELEFDSVKGITALADSSGSSVLVDVAVNDDYNTYHNDDSAEIVVRQGDLGLLVKLNSDCSTNYESPSPYANKTGVCKNIVLSAQFNNPVYSEYLNSSYINLYKCDADPKEADSSCLESVNLDFSTYLRDNENNIIGFLAAPFSDLDENTWYKGEILGSSEGVIGLMQLEGESQDVHMLNDYTWSFQTGAGSCAIDKILINPNEAKINEPNGEQEYIVNPIAANCNIINALSKNWDWSSSDDSKINFLLGTSPRQIVQALLETGSSPVKINVESSGKNTSSDLYIKFEEPRLIDHFPECNTACINSAIGMVFDQSIDTNPGRLDISLYKCVNESCLEYNSTLVSNNWFSAADGRDISPEDNKMFFVDLEENLDPLNFYKVIIKDVYGESSQKPLANYNFDSDKNGSLDSYQWIFKTKTDDELCEIQSVNLSPVDRRVTAIGERQDYLALPFSGPDACSPKGNYLNPYDFNWEWDRSETTRVSLSNQSISLELPSYCNSSCLLTGSQSNVIVCGNSTIEIGEDCDDGNTANGDLCSSNCLWEGTEGGTCGNGTVDYGEECDIALSTVACSDNCLHTGIIESICGNNKVEAGEACDDGNLLNNDGCSIICLNEGSFSVENTCGNGVLDYGESCDDGNIYNNDACSSTCLLEGYESYILNGEAVCGDGIAQGGSDGYVADARGEECDDSNIFNNDGCSSICLFEGNDTDCGNGAIDNGEACDDGNTDNDDGCSTKCLWEGIDFQSNTCGNKVVDRGEDCDDGNIYNNDGCSDSCLWEGVAFTSSDCGNGVRDYGEECDYAKISDQFICTNTCFLKGSSEGSGSVCGNGEIGEGEDCDDDNRYDGDGCSASCLNEGSVSGNTIAVCGNDIFEPAFGEECDDGNLENGDNCSNTCLNEGNELSSCGNTLIEALLGEECDDGNRINGDGCSNICLNEGSSYKYGSVCGNGGALELGEECEAIELATSIAPYQWATVEMFLADADSVNTSTATIFAKELDSQVVGTAKIVLECGFTNDDDCIGGSIDYGIGNNKCCYARPNIVEHAPLQGEIDVCRNPYMQVVFDQVMNEESIRENLTILRRVNKDDDLINCTFSKEYFEDESSEYSFCEFTNWISDLSVIERSIDGDIINVSLVNIQLKNVLEPDSEYYMVYSDEVRAQTAVSLKHSQIVLSLLDHEANAVNTDIYRFETAADVCELSSLLISNLDTKDDSPFTLSLPEREKYYEALSFDNRGKLIAAIPGVYNWSWDWELDRTDIISLDIAQDTEGNNLENVRIGPLNNGLSILTARAEVSADSLFKTACINESDCNSGICEANFCKEIVETHQNIDVFICANPWPTSRMYVNDMFNFAMRYCRDVDNDKICYGGNISGSSCTTNLDCIGKTCDSGDFIGANCDSDLDCANDNDLDAKCISEYPNVKCAKDIRQDLPQLRLSTVIPPAMVTESTGLLREYLFNVVREKQYCYDANLNLIQDEGSDLECSGDRTISKCVSSEDDDGYAGTCLALVNGVGGYESIGDIIGIRVFLNTEHEDIQTWYQANMPYSSASLVNKKVDGYGALQDGRNIYVHAANLVENGSSYDFYSNAYLFTHNSGADSKTTYIYDQLLESLYFNINLYESVSYRNWQDWQDSAYANKQKIIRDLKRLEDLQKVSDQLEAYKYNVGNYPTLTAGTLLPGVSYSVWPSWARELGVSIVDPINKFSTVSCPYSLKECIDMHGDPVGKTCDDKNDCEINESCEDSLDHLYNQKTCFNATTIEFDDEKAYFEAEDSYLYRYESLDNGARYRFDYHMEYLDHVMITTEGEEISMSLIGSAGECYADADPYWFTEGQGHPDQEFTYCHFGRWVSSCGNGIVEKELGEQCERSLNMCNETFGVNAWYDPQVKSCSECKWVGNCSNDRSMSCRVDDDCDFSYEEISCQEDPNIEGISTCQGSGRSVGKICHNDEDCFSVGECLSFENNYIEDSGLCELKIDDAGTTRVSLTSTYCNNDAENDCKNYYSEYYCQQDFAKVCANLVDGDGREFKEDLDCKVDETCGADPDLTCVDKWVCMDEKGRIEYEMNGTVPKICTSQDDCPSVDYTCQRAKEEEGSCYSQLGGDIDLLCSNDLDCKENIHTSCKILVPGGDFSKENCGGYCGDTIVQDEKEFCDWSNSDYASIDDPDPNKPYCSSTCQSSCPSGLDNNIFYSGDTYFLRKSCVGGTNDGLACEGIENVYSDCPDGNCILSCNGGINDGLTCFNSDDCTFGTCEKACDGGANDGLSCDLVISAECPDGICEVETLHDLVFDLENGFPSGLNLYLPACRRLAQGQWSCHSTDSDFQKEGAWCNADYPEHCVDKDGLAGTCVEEIASLEPSPFTTDIDFYNFSLPSINVLFITDVSGSMRTDDVDCDDPKLDNNAECTFEAVVDQGIFVCPEFTTDPSCLELNNFISGRYCTGLTGEVHECSRVSMNPIKYGSPYCETSDPCAFVDSTDRYYEMKDIMGEERRSCVDANSPHSDCLDAGVDECETDPAYSDKRIECAVEALTGEGGGIQQLVNLDQDNVHFGAITFSTETAPLLSNFTWYDKEGYADLETEINNYFANGGTRTDLAFDMATEIFTELIDSNDHSSKIAILLTDGDANEEDLARESAVALKELGVELYTITYPNAIGNSDLWSSECPADNSLLVPAYPPCSNDVQYSYQGIGLDSSLDSIYEDIINRVTGTLDVGDNSSQLFSGRYLPLPGNYQCATEAQLLPVNINLTDGLRGEVRMRNLKFNYCP